MTYTLALMSKTDAGTQCVSMTLLEGQDGTERRDLRFGVEVGADVQFEATLRQIKDLANEAELWHLRALAIIVDRWLNEY